MKQIGASHVVAMALTAFAAAGVSAQTGGVMTAVPATDAQACTVSGVAGASFHTSTDGNATYVTTADGQKIATVTRSVGGFGGGAVTAKTGDVNVITPAGGSGATFSSGGGVGGSTNGVVALRATTADGATTFTRVTPDGTSNGAVAAYTVKRAPDGTVTLISPDGTTKKLDSSEAEKFHVKRPASGTMTYTASGSENAVTAMEATTATHASLIQLDGSASPVACKIVVRQTDGGGN